MHTGVKVISGKVWVGVMTPRGVGKKQIVRYVFALVDAEKNTVATFATSTLRNGTTLTWHGVWLTVK